MKPLTPLLCGLAACLALPFAHAETCQWKDSAGRTVISDLPPPGNARDLQCYGESAAPPPPPAKATDKDADFKKRQQEGKEKGDKEAKDQQAAAAKKENCERAKSALTTLESGQRVSTVDEKGGRRVLEDAERQREIERTRKIIAESCS